MKKLKNTIRNTEIDALSDTVLRLYKDDDSVQKEEFLAGVMADLEKLSAKITSAILQDKIHSDLEKADEKRDEALKTLGKLLDAYSVFPIASKKELALPLDEIFEKYAKSGIVSANYASESSMIESLLDDLKAEGIEENIKALEGVPEAILMVRASEDAFKSSYDTYLKANADKGASATSFKKSLLSLVNDTLVPYLNAMQISGTENCREFAKNVESEINRMNDTVSRRAGKKEVEND